MEDAADIAAGTSFDCNGNSLPDECDVLPGELAIDIADLLPAGIRPGSLSAVDLDGDGVLDLVAANELSLTISVYSGRAGGTFSLPVVYPLGVSRETPADIAARDLDGDGAPDVITANRGNAFFAGFLSLFRNRGDGTLAAPVQVAAGQGPAALAVDDMDGDRILDLVVADDQSSEVFILRNEGGAVFSEPRRLPAGGPPLDVQVADLDGNGALDIITASESAASVSLFLQQEWLPGISMATATLTWSRPTAPSS